MNALNAIILGPLQVQVCVCVYICIHLSIYIYTHIYIYVYIFFHIYIYMYTYIYTHLWLGSPESLTIDPRIPRRPAPPPGDAKPAEPAKRKAAGSLSI